MHRDDLTDQMMLDRLLEHEDEILDDGAVQAFRGMWHKMKGGWDLTTRQKEWVARVYKSADIQRHYNENLMSRGKVRRGKPMEQFWWEKRENRPLKPPA